MRFQCDHVTVTVQMRMRLVECGCRSIHDEECDVEWCGREMWFVVCLRGGKTLFSHMSTTEKASGNFYMFGAVKLENPRYVFGPHPMTTAVFDGLVPCFALNDDDGSVGQERRRAEVGERICNGIQQSGFTSSSLTVNNHESLRWTCTRERCAKVRTDNFMYHHLFLIQSQGCIYLRKGRKSGDSSFFNIGKSVQVSVQLLVVKVKN